MFFERAGATVIREFYTTWIAHYQQVAAKGALSEFQGEAVSWHAGSPVRQPHPEHMANGIPSIGNEKKRETRESPTRCVVNLAATAVTLNSPASRYQSPSSFEWAQ
jgi:hypothetical protein